MELEKSWLTDYDFIEGDLTLFFISNWFLLALAVLLVVRIYQNKRYLFIKPSVLVATYAVILVQFPLAVYSTYCERTFKEPWVFSLLVHSFVFSGLLFGQYFLNKQAKEVWLRVISIKADVASGGWRVFTSLLLIVIAFLGAYLYYVPPTSSGLYAIFFNPDLSTIIREESLKTLEDSLPRYLYSFLTYGIAPLMAVVVSQSAIFAWNEKRIPSLFGWLVSLFALLVISSLTGERARAVELLLACFIAIFIQKGLPFRPLTILTGICLIFIPAAALSILREGMEMNFTNIGFYFWGIVMRAFRGPFEVATWHVQFVEEHGFWGIAGIPKLAQIFGEIPLNISNIVGLHFLGNSLETVSAGTGYLFMQHACFGLLILPISLLQLFLLDFAVVILNSLNSKILLPTLASSVVLCLGFLQSSYTTILLSSGLGVAYLVAFCISQLVLGRQGKVRYQALLAPGLQV